MIFAFATAVQKGHHFNNFAAWEKWLIGFALLFFVVSAVFGIATNTPRNYASLTSDTLRRSSSPNGGGGPQEPISTTTLDELIDALEVSQQRNDTKAAALLASIVCQFFAVVCVAAAMLAVIWP